MRTSADNPAETAILTMASTKLALRLRDAAHACEAQLNSRARLRAGAGELIQDEADKKLLLTVQQTIRRLQQRACVAQWARRNGLKTVFVHIEFPGRLMPKRTDISSILIIGAGPIVIGQAAEFDYSGSQAVKALKSEGYRVIVVNSNPATIMTDPELSDATYIEPITPEIVAKIIEKERPDALLPTMGGQTALNTALALFKDGTLDRLGVQLIGANAEAIEKAEDRQKFRDAMDKIGLESPRSAIVHSMEEAAAALETVGLPAVIRPSFTLGGTGGGIAYNRDEYEHFVRTGLEASPTTEVLIDESLVGWKEYEMEVVRDRADNAIIICSIENVDPMGVHTGDIDHRRAGADADRQGISKDALGEHRRAAGNRRRNRRFQRPVRGRSEDRADGGDRDEPARVALVGAGVQGDRLPDRQGRRAAGGRLHARRDRQRHHRRRDPGELRADDRLCRDQDPALRVREVQGRGGACCRRR